MSTFNPINANSIGIQNYQGSGNFVGETTTQYNILAGDVFNGISNISPGSSGQVLTSNGASSNPSFQNVSIPPFGALFSAYMSSTQSNITGDSTQATVIFDTTLLNVGSVYSTSTGKFTAPATGTYLFGYQGQASTSGTFVSCHTQFLINGAGGSNYKNQFYVIVGINTIAQGNESIILSLNSGDTVVVSILSLCVPSAKNVSMTGSSTDRPNSFWGFRLT